MGPGKTGTSSSRKRAGTAGFRPSAAILTIGAELLKGSVLNTNAQFLGRHLSGLGFEVEEQSSCPDSMPDLLRAFRRIFASADLVILSGGLGPTPDDLTRDAIAAFFRVPLVFSKRHFSFIRRYYRDRKKKVPEIVKKEAMFPANSVPLFNRFGIALGFYIATRGKLIVVLPGVPVELENMFEQLVVPVIRRQFKCIPRRYPVIARTVGMGEPEIMQRLGKDFFSKPFDFGIYPGPGEVALRLYAGEKRIASSLLSKIRARLGKAVYAYEETTLAEAIGRKLFARKKTLAIAESCTGGSCAAEIARVPGASRYLQGGIVAYQASVKKKLGVTDGALKNGQVSPEVAGEMAGRVREFFNADYGIGITGIAGPAGGSEKKPVGLVYISIAGKGRPKVHRHVFWGSRAQVQTKAVKKALEHLYHLL